MGAEALGFPLRAEAVLQTLTEDVVKSSEIEGAILDKDQVRSSIARRLGMDIGALAPADRDASSATIGAEFGSHLGNVGYAVMRSALRNTRKEVCDGR